MEDKNLKKQVHRGKTLFRKMIAPVSVILIFQVLCFYFALILSGNMDKLKNEKYSEFRTTVYRRAERVSDILVNKRNSVNFYKEKLEENIEEFLAERQRNVKDLYEDRALNDEIIADNADNIKELLKGSEGSGAFLILSGYGKENEQRCGYYLRNTKINSTDERYFTVLRGSEKILNQVGFTPSKNWRSVFRMGESRDGDYHRKISGMLDGNDTGFAAGYWSPVYSMYGDDTQIITYTVPLIDQEGVFYGMLGVEISVQMLVEELPYRELSSDGSSSYYLVYKEKDADAYSTMAVAAASGKDITNKNGQVTYSRYKGVENIYAMDEQLGGEYIGAPFDIEIYAPQSPFASERWSVIGIMDEKELFAVYNKFFFLLYVTFVLVILIGIAGEWYIAFRFCSYVRSITYVIQSCEPEETLELESTDLRDIQILADTIQDLYDRGTSLAKLVQIIDMAGVQVGAIEYNEEDKYVLVL